jgi:phospholipase/carboxylesterase
VSRAQLVARWSVPELATTGTDLLVLLHGYGANERYLLEQVTPVVGPVAVASLRGPIAEGSGFAWVSLETSLATLTPEAIAAVARQRAEPVLDWLNGLPPYRSVGLLGVSQGAVLALHLLRMAPDRFSYVVNLSGYVLPGPENGDAGLRQRRPPAFWGCGRHDSVIPRSYVERTAQWLPRHTTMTARSYPIGHQESPAELADVGAFVRSQVAG